MKTMSHKMKKTPLAVLFFHVEAYRRDAYLTREDFAQDVVNAHEAIGGGEVTGVVFDNVQRASVDDDDRRRRTNANKVFRWLDDSTKDRNYLHINLFPSILAALPLDRRVACLNEMFMPVCVVTKPLASEAGCDIPASMMLQTILKECGEAQLAVADLIDGATKPELVKAQKEIGEAVHTLKQAQLSIEARLASQ